MPASEYSPSLRIELIPTGEQSGTWGTTTNLNLGTLLEDGIAGYVAVIATAVSAGVFKYPLSTNNGAIDEARMAVIDLAVDGTITGAYQVFIPPVSKIYIIRNTSAYDVTIYVSTVDGNVIPKGDGLTIPAGKTTELWTDGTDVNTSSDFISGSVDISGGITLSTPLTAASGGTGLTNPSGVLVGDGTTITGVQPGTAGNLLQSNGTTWIASTAGAGSVGGGSIYETTYTLTTNYTLTAGKNGMTVGPFIIVSGASLTIPTGSRFVVI